MNMDDLANALNKSSATPKAKGGQPASSQPDLNGLLGALGGGQQAGGQPDLSSLLGMLGGGQSGGQPDLGSLLGMLGGGQSGQGGDALGGLLGGLLGGGSGSGAVSGGPLDSLVGPLAEKLGLPPQVAGMVVMFLANALLARQAGSRSGAASGGDLNDVMTMLDSGRMDSKALHNNQLVQDLSQQTGLDEQTAARSIGAVVDMLGGQQGLESLLGK